MSNDDAPLDAEAQLRQNVKELMDWRRMTQAVLAEKLGEKQPWLSRRLTGANKFTVRDLDALSRVFHITPSQLMRPGYGQWERRKNRDRRSGHERRGATHEVRPFPEREEKAG
jgi:transcriptional regulator with XRE-family HTH domain